MLIKAADDKCKRLRLLEDLQASPVLDARQRDWLKDEFWRVKKGMDGEREAAFHIDSLLRDSKNYAVLHDLRIKVGEDEAQIDHVIIHRCMDVILVETKCFGGNVDINEHGEFTADYGPGKRFGIPSPIAQSQRHERVLAKLLERLEITGRLGTKAVFHHLVMLHPKAIIKRPDGKKYDTGNVIKADQFADWRDRFIDQSSKGLGGLSGMLNLRSSDTIKEWAEKIARQHLPADLLELPDFMRPKSTPAARPAAGAAAMPAVEAPAPAPQAPALAAVPSQDSEAKPTDAASSEAPAKRLICASCGIKISYPEGKFCWNNPKRFGGLQYCREHQAAVQPA